VSQAGILSWQVTQSIDNLKQPSRIISKLPFPSSNLTYKRICSYINFSISIPLRSPKFPLEVTTSPLKGREHLPKVTMGSVSASAHSGVSASAYATAWCFSICSQRCFSISICYSLVFQHLLTRCFSICYSAWCFSIYSAWCFSIYSALCFSLCYSLVFQHKLQPGVSASKKLNRK
jgi:hypothetical protein